MMRVLMVCLGNICRSPMAEGILLKKIAGTGLSIEVDSAGTGNYHVGEHPDPRAIATARRFGVDISMLVARQFVYSDFIKFDRIFVMDQSNYTNVVQLARTADDRKKVELFLTLDPTLRLTEVPDPWFGHADGFIDVFQMLDQASDAFLKQIHS